jgi:peroxiredoxin
MSQRPTSARNQVAETRRDRWPLILVALAVVLIGVLYGVYRTANRPDPAGPTTQSDYQVGSPGKGEQAPAFSLPATKGGDVSLDQYEGKNVLVYFHEGLGCQPCWDQIRDLEKASGELKAAGVVDIVAITTGPVDLIRQKVADEKLTSMNLADTDLAVSRSYQANKYGMMGDDRDGHSFILVGPDGKIRWRADYGGAPNYTMYVPVQRLVADLETGTKQ